MKKFTFVIGLSILLSSFISKDEPLEIEKLGDDQYQIVQKSENKLRGKYKFTIKLRKKHCAREV